MMSINRYIIERNHNGKRVDQWFKNNFKNLNFIYIEKIIRTGQVRINSKRVKPSFRLSEGDEVRFPPFLSVKQKSFHRKKYDFYKDFYQRILYCDQNIIVINKPYGLAVQGGTKIKKSLDDVILSLNSISSSSLKLVHRIDKNTSGALIIARNIDSSRELQFQFRNSKIHKIYWAMVYGRPKENFGVINSPIKKKTVEKNYEKVVISSEGQRAQSIYSVVESNDKYSWLLMSPITGKTHQLRVHCSSSGFPIVGDHKYSSNNFARVRDLLEMDMMQLLSRKIFFNDLNEKKTSVVAPVPGHIGSFIKKIGFNYDTKKIEKMETIFEERIDIE